MRRDDIRLNQIYFQINKPKNTINEGIMGWITGKSKVQRENDSILKKIKALEDDIKKSGLNPEDFIDYNKINYVFKGESKPEEQPTTEQPIEIQQTPEIQATQQTPEVQTQTEPIVPPQPATQPDIKKSKVASKPKVKVPESKYYFVPNKFVEDNPPKVGQDYVSIPNTLEYLGISPKEYKELSQMGYLGTKRIDGVPYIQKNLIEGQKYFEIMTYLNNKDMEAKKSLADQESKKTSTPKITRKKPADTKKTSASKKSTTTKKTSKKS
jgi:hypothetical protein